MDLIDARDRWPYERSVAWLRRDPSEQPDSMPHWPSGVVPLERLLDRVRDSQPELLIYLTIGSEFAVGARVGNEQVERPRARTLRLPRRPERVAQEFLFALIRTVHVSSIASYSRRFVAELRRSADRPFASALQWLSDMAALPLQARRPVRVAIPQLVTELPDLRGTMGDVLGTFIAASIDMVDSLRTAEQIEAVIGAIYADAAIAITPEWIGQLQRAAANLIYELGGGRVEPQ